MGTVWIAAWLFTIGFLHLGFCKVFSPSFCGRISRPRLLLRFDNCNFLPGVESQLLWASAVPSRDLVSFANKLLSAMRYQFGGHVEKEKTAVA